MSRTDINKDAETVLIPLFKEIYGYKNLKNINYIESNTNYPSIDLGDEVARVAFQITATRKLDKIKHTLREFTKYKLYEKYDRLIIYILTHRQKTYSDQEINKILQESSFDFHLKKDVWDSRNILTEINKFQIDQLSTIERILEENFGERRFVSTPFVSYEKFFYSWLNANQLFNHTWKLEGRDDTLKSLHEFVTSSDKQIAILPGRGGIGKTKLLYEFAKSFGYSDFLLWFVEKDKPVTSENADSLPLNSCVIVVDDAHQSDEQDLKTLLALICKRARDQQPQVKLVLSSRPYAIQLLQVKLRDGGIGSSQVQELGELKELAPQKMKALARQALGQNYTHFADQLAAIAHDSPLVAVVGGRLLANQAIPLSLLERNPDFQYEVLNRFQEILVGQVSQQIKPECCKKILELMAAIAPIQPTDEQFQKTAIEFLKIQKRDLIKSISVLEKAGVLLRRGNKLRITPDVLADHILHNACLTEQGDSTGYAQEIFEAFREIYPGQVVRNLSELDWRIRSISEQKTDLLDTVLPRLKEEFKQASNLDRCRLLELIKEIAYYQPGYSLEIVQLAMRHPATTPEDESVSERYRFTHSNVLSKLPQVLNRISYTLDYVPICCDLLWQLGRDDASRPRNNPPESIRILIKLAKYGTDKPIKFNWPVLEAVERWLQEPNIHEHIYSPLDILDPFFDKEIEHNDSDGKMVEISTFLVDHKIAKMLRSKALKLIEGLLKSNNIKVSLRALESLRKALKELRDQSSQPLKEANQWWEPEQLEILEMIHSLVSRDIEPLIQLEAIKKLDWYTRFSSLSTVQQKAKNIVASIPQTDKLKLTGTLTGNYGWNPQANEFGFDWREHEQVINQINKDIVESFLKKYPSPQQGIQIFNERLQVITANGGNILTGFLTSLAALNPSYSIELCEQVLKMGDCPLAIHIAPMLYQVRNFDSERTIKVFQFAVNSGVSSFCRSFAETYWAWENDIAPDSFYNLIKTLLIHPALEVRKSAIESLAMLIQSQPQLAISLALNVEINENTELAEKLFNALSIRNSLELLKDEELRTLLCKLERICNLSEYYISEFLVYAAQKIPYFVLQLILNRIDLSVKKDDINYDSLPSNYYENCLHYLSSAEEYEDMLRKIRDLWFDYQAQTEIIFSGIYKNSIPNDVLYSFKLELLYKKLYKESSFAFIKESERAISFTSLSLLNEWINSEDAEKIRAASRLMREFHAGFIFGHFEFVSNLLEQAYKAGDECYETVSSNLLGIAASGVKMGIPGQPFSEDVRLRDQASAIAKQFRKGSPVRKFFDSLAEYAESDIKSQQMLDEEHWG